VFRLFGSGRFILLPFPKPYLPSSYCATLYVSFEKSPTHIEYDHKAAVATSENGSQSPLQSLLVNHPQQSHSSNYCIGVNGESCKGPTSFKIIVWNSPI